MRLRFDSVAGFPGDDGDDEFDPKNPASEAERVPPPHLRTVCGLDCKYRQELTKIRTLLSPEITRILNVTGFEPTAYSAILELSSRAASLGELTQEVRRLSGCVSALRGSIEAVTNAVAALEATVLQGDTT